MFYFIKCRKNVRLSFENETINITCIPNYLDEIENNGFDSSPSNGEFSFYFDSEEVTFSSSNNRRSNQGGGLYITIKMTAEIKKSLDKAMNDWKQYLEENKYEDEDEF
jgi:hypothetical protein